MKISILLPYKENFSRIPGAVSLFVYETSKISKFKDITVYGNTSFKNLV